MAMVMGTDPRTCVLFCLLGLYLFTLQMDQVNMLEYEHTMDLSNCPMLQHCMTLF